MMAAALSYRVLFSMLPLLVLAGAIARLSVSRETFLRSVQQLIKRLGLEKVEVAGGAAAGSQVDLGSWLEGLATRAASYDVTGLTWIGGIVLAWAAYRLFDEVEASLSVIGSGMRRRKTWVRLVVSLLVLVIGPAAAAVGLQLLDDLTAQIDATGIALLSKLGTWFLSFLAVWLFVALAYRFIPAGKLTWRSAGGGAFVAAISLIIGEWALERVLVRSISASPLGGALGVVPVLMLWVYIMWLCVLYGMEVAVLSHRASRQWRRRMSAGGGSEPSTLESAG